MKEIQEYAIETNWDHSQYWQGAGLSFTIYEDLATGIGSSEMEAAEDACEQLAQNDWDTSSIDISECSKDNEQICEDDEGDECEHHYFTTIRVLGVEEDQSQRDEDNSIYSQMVYRGLSRG